MLIPARTPHAKEMLLGWLSVETGVAPEEIVGDMPYEACAVVRHGMHAGVVLYTNYRGHSMEMAWAGRRDWATRRVLRQMFEYPFVQLGVLRVSGCVARENSASRLFAKRIGCREAGILEHEYGPGRDGVLYTMTRERCKWIGVKNEEITESTRSIRSKRGANEVEYRHSNRTAKACDDWPTVGFRDHKLRH
jgi:hypothetical protein